MKEAKLKNHLKIIFLLLFFSQMAFAKSELDFRSTNELSPNDYLFGAHGNLKDPVFDSYRTVDLNVDLGIGSDCGRMDVKSTLRAALKNVLDAKYFEDMGKDIVAASPMLLTCYFSPTWCAILKHSRVRADFLAQLRLNQCGAINKYVDTRVSDYYEERSECVQKAIKRYGGNFEQAMESCKNYDDYNIANWSGDGKSFENRLIESTAKWAGFKGKTADHVVELTKAFIGDTIIKKGTISVDYGPRRVQLTPRTYLMEVKGESYNKLCKGLFQKVVHSGGYKSSIFKVISDNDLRNAFPNKKPLIDRQTLISLAYLPYNKREIACRKLSDAIAMTVYSEDMGQTLDFISSKMGTNPHLPEKRRLEAEQKRRAFKDQVEMTLALEKQNTEPLNQVLFQINSEGGKYMRLSTGRQMEEESDSHQTHHLQEVFFDCADGVGC